MSKPITLYSHASGPNPWKVAIILEELGLPYESKMMDMGQLKKEPYVSLNPNGRVPCIEDPNTGIVLWESGAIVEYLIETYDKSNKLSFSTSPEKFYCKQYLMFQMSGQGPYFGQGAWFKNFHHEKLPSAIERYEKEVRRVVGVLDSVLKDKEYLVGGKCTYADLVFLTWSGLVPWLLGESGAEEVKNECPHYTAWIGRLMERPAVKKVFEDKAKATAKGH